MATRRLGSIQPTAAKRNAPTKIIAEARRRTSAADIQLPILDFPKLMQEYLKHDGCLLISDDPNLVEIADQFELIGKPVWRYLAEVPRAAG